MRNIFESEAEALVCPTNGVGVMGAGLAKQFADRFPNLREMHQIMCFDGAQKPGVPLHCINRRGWGKEVILMPTKRHWRDRSDLDDVTTSIMALADLMDESPTLTIALPMIGCGLGGLDWTEVKPLILEHLDMDRVDLYENA